MMKIFESYLKAQEPRGVQGTPEESAEHDVKPPDVFLNEIPIQLKYKSDFAVWE